MLKTFCRIEDGAFVAHEWEVVNGTLLARWKGGKATQSMWSAKAKPKLSQGDKSREDKRGVERRDTETFFEESVPPGSGANGSHPTAKKNHAKINGLVDSEWIARLKADNTYEGIDVDRELGRANNWCNVNGKTLSRRRFVNWLNRAERPMKAGDIKSKEKIKWIN